MPRAKSTTQSSNTTKSKDIIQVTHEGKTVEVDLNKMCPPELFKKLDVPGRKNTMYISAPLVREVIRCRGGIEVTEEQLDPPIVGTKNAILQATAKVTVDGEIFAGTGLDVIGLKKFAVASMGQGGHVAALALKSALKKRFKFFEGDFATAEIEGSEYEELSLDDLAKEVSELVDEPNETVSEPEVETPVVEEKVEEAKVEPIPEVVEEKVETPVVEEKKDGLDDIMIDEDDKMAPEKTPEKTQSVLENAIKLMDDKMAKAKASGKTLLPNLVALAKEVVIETGIEGDDYKKLTDYLQTKIAWFTN